MALLKYLIDKDCLLDPRGSLSTVMPSKAIFSANEAVRCEIEVSSNKKPRGPYKRCVHIHIYISGS